MTPYRNTRHCFPVWWIGGVRLWLFTCKEAEILVPKHPILPTFYHLPKTHKRLNLLHGRPNISGIRSLNERLGQWLDKLLQPLAVRLLCYLKDINHLFQIVNNLKWEDNFSWLACDVCSLYFSIPHHLAIEAISFYSELLTELPVEHRSFILHVLEFLLSHNYFTIDGGFFLQTSGAAMGQSFRPPLPICIWTGWESGPTSLDQRTPLDLL